MIRRILKVGAWILASILGLGIAAYGTAVAINWRDQEPSATALRLATEYRERPALADEDNAFIYVMGFDALPERQPPQPALKQFREACAPGSARCAEAFANSDEVFAQWIAAEGWLLQRYETLLTHGGWREVVPTDLSTPFPPYAGVTDGQRLLLLKARMLAEKGDHGAVKKLLADDLRFWRTVIESSDGLISKMIATSALNRHFEWGNLVMKELAPAQVALAIPAEWDEAITDSERSLRRCVRGEWIFGSAMVPQMSAGRFYQPQDSINELAGYYSHVADLLDAPLRNYQTAMDQARAARERREQGVWRDFSLYNFANRILLTQGSTEFESYAARVNDIEGVRRAALAAVRFRERNVPASDVAAALETAPFRDPYNDRPFDWDDEHGMIIFTGLEPAPRGQHLIKY